MRALTVPAQPPAVLARRQAVRRGPRSAPRPTGVDALHAEIDNPLDQIAGRVLLPDAGLPPGGPTGAGHGGPSEPGDCTRHPLDDLAGQCPTGGARVFLIERHPVAAAGLRSVLATVPGMTVVGSTADPVRALAGVHRVRPDVILLGRGSTLGDDLAAVVRLRGAEGAPQARVLLLRRAESTAEASRMLLAGASGCFPLDLAEDRIIGAVALAAAGGSVFLPAPPARVHPASLARHAAERLPQHCGLTDRERDVLAQLARGLSNAEIGRELALAEATVKKHLTQAMRKTGQPDRLRAALYAHRHGLAV